MQFQTYSSTEAPFPFRRLSIVTIFPVISNLWTENTVAPLTVDLLQATNIAATTTEDCEYLERSVQSWLKAMSDVQTPYFRNDDDFHDTYVLWAQLLPVRCDWQNGTDGVITICPENWEKAESVSVCTVWKETRPATPSGATRDWFADLLDIRPREIVDLERSHVSANGTTYSFRALFNESNTVAYT